MIKMYFLNLCNTFKIVFQINIPQKTGKLFFLHVGRYVIVLDTLRIHRQKCIQNEDK